MSAGRSLRKTAAERQDRDIDDGNRQKSPIDCLDFVRPADYPCDMTIHANVHEAKTRLSELLDRVQKGQEVIIAKAGTPCARLVPIYPDVARIAGAYRGIIGAAPLGPLVADDESWG